MEVNEAEYVFTQSGLKEVRDKILFEMMKTDFSWGFYQESAEIQQFAANFQEECVGMFETTLLELSINSDIDENWPIFW